MSLSMLFALVFSFIFFFIIFRVAFLWAFRHKINIDRRVDSMSNEEEEVEEKGEKKDQSTMMRWISWLGKQLPWKPISNQWEERLIVAGVTLKLQEFYVVRVMFVLFTFFILVAWVNIWVALLSILLTWFYLPRLYLKIKTKKRLDRSITQLANALGTMSNSMRAGFSFMQSMQVVAKEMPDPIGPEFELTIKEINLGGSYEEAFDQLLRRLPNKDLEMVVSALLIQRQSGGNLAVLLETLRDTIQGRLRVKDEVRTLTAQGRISSWIISLLPIGLALVINVIHPGFFEPLFTNIFGWMLIIFGALFFVIGWLLINKIVQVEV
ncbi:tight adherence protein B [Alkalibacillus filiformis]|uniref:Tight adherence protein B n=1 Tax=Alkalibacillus filiformis TaxID=200990 RepID=A0ABU0DQQ5_9BACI|nr:type II secretion system F family protein [Alkalibacillus filiformis]MDQ0350777.1 tight adherence protein B [Alkalibacillus filiformis]